MRGRDSRSSRHRPCRVSGAVRWLTPIARVTHCPRVPGAPETSARSARPPPPGIDLLVRQHDLSLDNPERVTMATNTSPFTRVAVATDTAAGAGRSTRPSAASARSPCTSCRQPAAPCAAPAREHRVPFAVYHLHRALHTGGVRDHLWTGRAQQRGDRIACRRRHRWCSGSLMAQSP